MKGHKIEVNKRELSSKKSFVKNLRNQDEIPGIYYSHDSKDSIPFDPITTKRCSLNGCNQLTKICPSTPFLYLIWVNVES